MRMHDTDTPTIAFRRLRPELDKDIPLPRYMTPQAAGMDISAAVNAPLRLTPGEIVLVPTGFAMALPADSELARMKLTDAERKAATAFFKRPGRPVEAR